MKTKTMPSKVSRSWLAVAIIAALFAAGIVSDFGKYVKPAVDSIFTGKPS